MSTANKLLYLGETKSILKDTINMSNANITNSTTFRNYAMQLKEGYIDILNNGTDTLYNNFTHLTGKGMTLSFAPTYQAPMKITCYGSTSQASTPTPSSPVDVVNTTGNQTISVSDGTNTDTYNIELGTKNELDVNNTLVASRTATGLSTQMDIYGGISLVGTSTGTSRYWTSNDDNKQLIKAGTYTFFMDTTDDSIEGAIQLKNASTSATTTYITSNHKVTFTYTDDFYVYNGKFNVANNTNYNALIHFYIIKGSEVKKASDNPIELCKIGDYEDKIFKATNEEGLVSGKWYLKKNIGKVVNEIAAIGTLSSGYVYGYKTALWENKKIGTFGGICNKALFSTDRTPNTFYENVRNFAFVGDTNDTLETMKEKYNGADVYYVLATPTYTKITDSTLIEQLEAIKSKDNTTNITSSMVIGAIALKKE